MMIEMRTDANNEMKRQQDSHSKLTAVIDDIEMKLNTVVSQNRETTKKEMKKMADALRTDSQKLISCELGLKKVLGLKQEIQDVKDSSDVLAK